MAGLSLAIWLSWPQLRFKYLFEPLGRNAQGYPEYRHRKTGIIMVQLPGGPFVMGSPESEPERRDNESQQDVVLSPFLISKYEVSQAEWIKVMGKNPSRYQPRVDRGTRLTSAEMDHQGWFSLPVESIDWLSCLEFCRLTGFKLPTEAQWEFACRAGTTTPFSFGDNMTSEQANYRFDKPYRNVAKTKPRFRTVRVDSFAPNPFGLYNMHGNVSEYCQDSFSESSDRLLTGKVEPIYIDESTFEKVVRGGSWSLSARECRSASRFGLGCGNSLGPSSGSLGFRPVYQDEK